MTKQEEIRAQIIAAEAARDAARISTRGRPKRRSNWAASSPVPPPRRFARRPLDKK